MYEILGKSIFTVRDLNNPTGDYAVIIAVAIRSSPSGRWKAYSAITRTGSVTSFSMSNENPLIQEVAGYGSHIPLHLATAYFPTLDPAKFEGKKS